MRWLVALAFVWSISPARAEERDSVKVVGTVKKVMVRDVSKTASVRKPYTYFSVAVESVEPARYREQLGARVEFTRQGDARLAVGMRVEVMADAGSAQAGERLGAAELKILP